MSAANLTKRQLIDAIIAAQGKNHAPRAYLQGRTIEQLRETYSRWISVSRLSEQEIRRHCNVSFIK